MRWCLCFVGWLLLFRMNECWRRPSDVTNCSHEYLAVTSSNFADVTGRYQETTAAQRQEWLVFTLQATSPKFNLAMGFEMFECRFVIRYRGTAMLGTWSIQSLRTLRRTTPRLSDGSCCWEFGGRCVGWDSGLESRCQRARLSRRFVFWEQAVRKNCNHKFCEKSLGILP